MTQPDLFSYTSSRKLRFNGSDYKPEADDVRLTGQINRVFNLMKDGAWRGLKVIAEATGDPEASVSAQLRHLRKERFGSHSIEKRNQGEGFFEYRLILNPNSKPSLDL